MRFPMMWCKTDEDLWPVEKYSAIVRFLLAEALYEKSL